MRLLYAELVKVRTAPRTALGLVLGLIALVGLGSAATASDAGGEFGEEMATWDVIRVGSIVPVFTLILGILVVTWEYRHGTITQTFLASPRREQVIGAKLVLSLLAGAILCALALAMALAVASLWISVGLDQRHWELIGRMLLGAALWGALGAGLGALMQSQVGAIVTTFVWFLVAEPLLGAAVGLVTDSAIPDYLPGSVLDRLQNAEQGVEIGSGGVPVGPEYAFGLWAAALLAAIYAAGFGALGVLSAARRDVP